MLLSIRFVVPYRIVCYFSLEQILCWITLLRKQKLGSPTKTLIKIVYLYNCTVEVIYTYCFVFFSRNMCMCSNTYSVTDELIEMIYRLPKCLKQKSTLPHHYWALHTIKSQKYTTSYPKIHISLLMPKVISTTTIQKFHHWHP